MNIFPKHLLNLMAAASILALGACAVNKNGNSSASNSPTKNSVGPGTAPNSAPSLPKPNSPLPKPEPPAHDRPVYAADHTDRPDEPKMEARWISSGMNNTGCYAYLPVGFPDFNMNTTAEEDSIYTAEMPIGDFTFINFTIKPREQVTEGNIQAIEAQMNQYLESMENVLGIVSSRVNTTGLTINSDPTATGRSVTWSDNENYLYFVTAWSNGKYLGLQMIRGKSDYPYEQAGFTFLNGFRFK